MWCLTCCSPRVDTLDWGVCRADAWRYTRTKHSWRGKWKKHFVFSLLVGLFELVYNLSSCRQSYPKSTAGQKRSWRSRYFPTLCLIIHCSETKITHSRENTNKNTHTHTFRVDHHEQETFRAVQILCRYVVPALDNQRLSLQRVNWTCWPLAAFSDQTHIISPRLGKHLKMSRQPETSLPTCYVWKNNHPKWRTSCGAKHVVPPVRPAEVCGPKYTSPI